LGQRIAQLVGKQREKLDPVPVRISQLAFQAVFLGDVARDLRRSHNLAIGVANRRNGERDIEQPAILRLSHRLEALDALAATQALENDVLLVLPIVGNQQRNDGLPHRLLRRIAEEALSGRVPRRDDAVERRADDRVVRRFDDGRKKAL
jgi:hypothetical protein